MQMAHCPRGRNHHNLQTSGMGVVNILSPYSVKYRRPTANTTQSRYQWSRAVSLCLQPRFSDADACARVCMCVCVFVCVCYMCVVCVYVGEWVRVSMESLTPGYTTVAPNTAVTHINTSLKKKKNHARGNVEILYSRLE